MHVIPNALLTFFFYFIDSAVCNKDDELYLFNRTENAKEENMKDSVYFYR